MKHYVKQEKKNIKLRHCFGLDSLIFSETGGKKWSSLGVFKDSVFVVFFFYRNRSSTKKTELNQWSMTSDRQLYTLELQPDLIC